MRVSRGVWLGLLVCGACSGEPTRFAGNPTDAGADAPDVPTTSGQCNTQADCDDRQACTDDTCIVGHVCQHDPITSRCASGQRCVVGMGCVSATACRVSADCDDGVPCTTDLCGASGACDHVRNDARCTGATVCTSRGCVAAGTCGVDADCDDSLFCNGAERCASGRCTPGAAPDCADGEPCTGDVCDERTRMCTHPRLDPCGGAVTSGTYVFDAPPQYSCGAGTFGPVASVTLTATTTGVTVTGFPVTMTGGAASMGMFSVSGSGSMGACTWNYRLSGSFTMPTRFSGSWNVSFDSCDASNRCLTANGLVTGTMR